MATSATLMVPCPWARDAASHHLGEDVGVHLTLNAEWDLYRWGPITQAPSLLDGDGGFPRTQSDVWEHADVDEVRRELWAQVERAVLWGFDVTHLDSHMGTLQLRPEFFDVYLDLAVEFGLPLRLSGASTERAVGFPFRQLAADEGVVFPDHFVRVPGVGSRKAIEAALAELRPGVTEMYVHPAIDTPEQRAFDGSTGRRGSTTTTSSPSTPSCPSCWPGATCTASATARCATSRGPADRDRRLRTRSGRRPWPGWPCIRRSA